MAGLFGRLRGRKREEKPCCAAVVPAAGTARRMGGREKLLESLGEMPVLAHTLRALDNCPYITEIVVVTRGDLIVPVGQLCRDCAFSKVTKVVLGGETRTHSVLAGIREVSPEWELIAIHDGARPLVSAEVLEEAIVKAASCGAAAPAVPVKDTVKRAAGGVVEETLERASLFAVQTPQVFEAGLIKAALTKALEEGAELTDDCAAVERLGMKVALTRGAYENLKITTVEDLILAEALLEWRESL